MDVQYIGGCSVHRGDTMSTSGGYHEYIGGYHEYIGGCSVHRRDIMIHVGEQLDKILSISIENSDVLNIPRCTEHPDVLMISSGTHDIPQCTHGIPRCTEHSPMYSWYPPTSTMISPDVLMISPRCTHGIPPMY